MSYKKVESREMKEELPFQRVHFFAFVSVDLLAQVENLYFLLFSQTATNERVTTEVIELQVFFIASVACTTAIYAHW